MQKVLQNLKTPCRAVVVAVAGEAEVDQFPELFALTVGHEGGREFVEGRAKIRCAGLGVSIKIAEVVLHREREERHAVVEDRGEGTRFVAPVVDQQSEVAEVAVGVAHQRVENHHVAERLIKLVAELLQFGGDLGQFFFRETAVDRHEGMINVREKFAGTAQRPLPFRQLVSDVVQPHGLGNLGSVKFGIRLVAGVRPAGTAALVEHDLSADTPPAFAQVAVGGEFGRRRKRARTHTAEPGPGDQRQRLVEAVFKEVVVLEFPLEALRHDPVAVIDGETHAQFDDAEDVVVVQSVDGKDLVHKLTVAVDDAASQPVEQAFVGQLEPQRKQPAMTLLFFELCTGKAVQPLRPQVEGEQSCIILFQDEFHCLLRFFPICASSPKGNTTHKLTIIYCSKR